MKGLRWGLVLLAAGAAGLLLWRLRRFPDPPRARLAILVSGDGAPGLQALLQDLAESQGRWVVVPAGAPAPQLRVQARRKGSGLELTGGLGGAPLPACAGTPSEALAALAGRLGLQPPGPRLLPAAPDRAWELLDLAGRSQDETSRDLLRRAEALVAAEPGCAEARLALASLQTRFLVERVDADTLEAQQACEANLQAALDLTPDLPRLVELAAIHYSDVGRQREALTRLQAALRRHPGALPLDNALAYAARTSGLLDLADRALERQARLSGLPRGPARLADNGLLYAGRYAAFEAGVRRLPAGPLRAFYLGYARLVQGDREAALKHFSETPAGGLGSVLFLRLSEIYRLALEGRAAEALARLQAFETERLQIHLPDGEFTFKLAEAYGFLGRPREALEVAERAAVQGFTCTPWFERSPFLAGARGSVQWPSLDQHLRERQRLLEEAFPPKAFGL